MAEHGKLSPNQARDLGSSVLHLTIYSVLLFTYFWLVLRFLTGWLKELFHAHRVEYASVAIVLMIVQAVGLEVISYGILRLVRGKKS
jgi:Kef-type K+ transport system membrane component KefB